MKHHVKLNDLIEANNLLMAMGGDDQLPRIASAAIERSLELQHRVDRAIRYGEEVHSSSLHAKQILRILDGSITIDDEANEVVPEPVVHPLDEYPRLVRRPLTEAPAPRQTEGRGMAGRSTAERKAFRDWLASHGIDLPLNKTVPQHLLDDFDEARGGHARPAQHEKRAHHKKDKSPRGKLKPGHGLEGRSAQERLHIRTWLAEQGFEIAPSGRIPQQYIDHYDIAMAELKRMQREQKQQQQQPVAQVPEQGQEQHAQGA
jgi:hypothetical protein